MLKRYVLKVFKALPFQLQAFLARGNPSLAFYIDKRPKNLIIDYYLGKYRVDIDVEVDLQRRMLSGQYEPGTLAIISRFVKSGNICLDIGANIGAITLALADRVGPHGRVESFEPSPSYFERLKKNISLNPELISRVGLHQIGLSDRAGELQLQKSSVYSGTASMYEGVHDPNAPMLTLPVIRLDDFEPARKLAAIHFMKIDVDGLEREILKGAEKLIRKHQPILFFETTLQDQFLREAAAEIEKFLVQIGYTLYKIQGKKHSLIPTRFPDLSVDTVAICRSRVGM